MTRPRNNCDSTPPDFNTETAPPTLEIDWDAYLPFFEDENISDGDKQELIEALWSIVVGFVDLGFGVHPVQQVCGKDISLAELPMADVLNSNHQTATQNDKVTPQSGVVSERSPK